MWVTNKLYLNEIIQKFNIRFNPKISFAEDMCFNLDYYKYVKEICFINGYYSIYNRNVKNSLSRRNEYYNISLMIDSFRKIKNFLKKFNKTRKEEFYIAQKNLIIYATQKVLNFDQIDDQQKNSELRNLLKYKKVLLKYLNANDIFEKKIILYLKTKNYKSIN